MRDPVPRVRRRPSERRLPTHLGQLHRFAVPKAPPESSFYDVACDRRSSRSLGPANLEAIGELLWYAMRVQNGGTDGVQHRLAASAGGLHPIDLLLVRRGRLYLYDAVRHGLRPVKMRDSILAEMKAAARQLLPDARGDFLVLAAHAEVTGSKYLRPASLLWRDAGCVLQSIYLTAAWLKLGVCALGLLGHDAVVEAYSATTVFGAGMCVIGQERD